MGGLSQAAMASSLVMLVSALCAVGIEDFALFTFDDRVRLVKAAAAPWDAAAQAALLAHLRADTGFRTMDAAAVEMAVAAVLEAGVRGPKRVYVLTDGFSSNARQLAYALHRADRAGVDVVGVGVGTDMVITQRVYQHWLNAALPAALPDAFRELYGADEGAALTAAEATAPGDFVARHRPAGGVAEESIADILAARSAVFRDVAEQLQEEREAKLASGGGGGVMSIDLAFVLDVTGSMAPVLAAIRSEIANIAREIPRAVAREFPAIKLLLRVALVPFRDHGDALPPITPFADARGEMTDAALRAFNEAQAAAVTTAVNALRAEGGGDIAEDTLGALRRAMTGLVWTSKVRYAILITDAPPHGARFHGADVTDDRTGDGSQLDAVAAAIVVNQTELVLCHVDRTATAQLASELSMATVRARRAHPNCVPESPLLQVDLYDPAAPAAAASGGIHAVFVLDESGSMQSDFPGVVAHYNRFLGIRRAANQGRSNDLVSVVNFGTEARIITEATHVSAAPTTLPFANSGTDFAPAMTTAAAVLSRDVGARAALTPVLIFMSDGCGNSGEAQLRGIRAAHGHRGLQVHVLAFGSADATALRAHAVAGGGTFHSTPDLASLGATFEAIARATQGASGLVREVANRVGKQIANRVVLDHL